MSQPILKTEKDKKQFLKWITALRSGKYNQSSGTLQDANGFCCLGLGCVITTAKNKLDYNLFSSTKFISGWLPNSQDNAPSWLKIINDDFEFKAKSKFFSPDISNYPARLSLSMLNDEHGFTFDEIADMLELVYIHGAFDETL